MKRELVPYILRETHTHGPLTMFSPLSGKAGLKQHIFGKIVTSDEPSRL